MKNSELKQWLIDESKSENDAADQVLSRIYELELALQRMVTQSKNFRETARALHFSTSKTLAWQLLDESIQRAESVLNAE